MFDILSAAIAALNRYGRNEIFDALLGRNSKYGLLEPHEIGMLPEQVEPFIRGHTNSYMKRLLADDPTLILCPR